MTIDKDKIVFEALQKVLHDKKYRWVGEAFKACNEDLQRILPSIPPEQQEIVMAYIHTLTDVYVAALTVAAKQLHTKKL